jgi:hypothetical protein
MNMIYRELEDYIYDYCEKFMTIARSSRQKTN